MNVKRMANVLVGLVATLHLAIAFTEMFLWKHLDRLPVGANIYRRLNISHDAAIEAAGIVANAGFFNGLIAVGLIWTLIDRSGAYRVQVFLLGCVIVSGLFGAVTLDWPALILQTLPGAVALYAVMRNSTRHCELGREYVPPNEEQDIEEVIRLSSEILSLTGHPILRGQHAKGTGAVRAKFIIENERPAETRFGVFAETREYDAIVRFSNGVGRIAPDFDKDARGMAIKVLNVEGPRALKKEADSSTQDFVMINFPTFAFSNARQYAAFTVLKRFFIGFIGPAGNQVSQLLFFIPWHLRQFWSVGRKIKRVSESVLAERYWSMSPYRLGPRAIKFMVRPQETILSTGKSVTPGDRLADFLSHDLVEYLRARDARFDFLVQFQTDPALMPIEDPTVIWSELDSMPVKVATLIIEKNAASSAEDSEFWNSVERMSFNPWHSLTAHEPLGGINRLRKGVYQANAKRRQ
jgi:uncharacterized membrane protein